jgi:hypothetical protein
MQQRSGVSDHVEALEMELDDNLWGCLVHPPQLHCISHIAWESTNLLHMDIQGELEGKLGMQQQQGILQETWGESWWEEIVRALRQGKVTRSHLQPNPGLAKNSTNVMHNGRLIPK